MRPNFDPQINQLWLDLDGVFADFDGKFLEISGYHPKEYEDAFGRSKFWKIVYSNNTFFYELDLMPDCLELWEAVVHLDPKFLTGGHDGGRDKETTKQKQDWVAKYFPDTDVIVCKSKEKKLHMTPGDVIVDDFVKHQKAWEEAGGWWVLHKNAKDSISQLKELGVL